MFKSEAEETNATIQGAPPCSPELSEAEIDCLCSLGVIEPTSRPDWSLVEERCVDCGKQYPWPSLKPGATVSLVVCPRCDRPHFAGVGSGVDSSPAGESDKLQEVLMGQQAVRGQEAWSRLVGPGLPSEREGERRGSGRTTVSLPVLVVPFNEEAVPIGAAEQKTLVDLSQTGAGLIGERGQDAPLLLIDFGVSGAPGTQALARVVWREESEGLAKLGCRFC